jgi:hypothetical protein
VAILEAQDAITVGEDARIVGNQNDGAAMPVSEPLQKLDDRPAAREIERGGRLITEHNGRVAGQSAGDGHALFLAAAEISGKCLDAVLEVHFNEKFLGAPAGSSAANAAHVHRERDIFDGTKRRKQVEALENKPDEFPADPRQFLFGKRGDFLAEKLQAPGRSAENAAKDGKKRGLAASGRTHEQGELAGMDVKVDVRERAELGRTFAVDLAEPSCANGGAVLSSGVRLP